MARDMAYPRVGEADGHPPSYLFTVRFWPEALADGQPEWRGQIHCVLDGETCYFREWVWLVAFLERKLRELQVKGADPTQPPSTM